MIRDFWNVDFDGKANYVSVAKHDFITKYKKSRDFSRDYFMRFLQPFSS